MDNDLLINVLKRNKQTNDGLLKKKKLFLDSITCGMLTRLVGRD